MKKISSKLTSGILALSMLISTAPMLAVSVSAEETSTAVVLAEANFESFTRGDKITYDAAATYEIASRTSSHADGAFIGCCSTAEQVDSSKEYFIERGTDASPGTVTIVNDPDPSGSHGKVVSNTGWRFGISEHKLESSGYTDDMQRNSPQKIKFEFDLYRRSSTTSEHNVTVRYGNPYAGGQLFRINHNNTITVYTESLTGTNTEELLANATAPSAGQWASYALSLDVVTRRCILYIDGSYKGSWTLDDAWSTAHPDFIIGGYTHIDNIKVSVDTDYQQVIQQLGNNIAVMNFSRNAIKNGAVVPIDADDMVITDESGTSIAPLTFFENVLGATVSGTRVTLDGVGKNFSGNVVTYDGKQYLRLSEALTALGKNNQTFDMITMTGTDQVIDSIKSDEISLENLKTVLNESHLSEADVTADDWKYLKDKWRKLLVGSEDLDTSDENVKIKLSRVNAQARSALNAMRTDWESSTPHALFGSTDVKTTEIMTEQYTRLYYISRAYATKGSSYYQDAAVKTKIFNALEWLHTNFYGNFTWVPTGSNSDWDWIVGTPTDLSKTLIIMENELGSELIEKYLAPYDYWRLNKTEQTSNRLLARTAIAALREDFDAMKAMQMDFDRTLKMADSGGGVQEDWMYVTHKYYAYTSAYGSNVLAERLVLVESILSGTKFEFATPYKYNSCMWMYETFAPVMFNGAITSAFSGRFRTAIFSEESYTRYAIGAMLDLIGAFGKDDDVRLKEIIKRNIVEDNKTAVIQSLEMGQVEKLAEILNDTSVSTDPYYISRVYYTGDAAVHQKGDFGFALAMSSSRIGAWESISGQNIKGWYQGDGLLLMHLADDILQYNDVYWDNVNPYHLPGTTVDTQERVAQGIAQEYSHLTLTNQDFVGGVSLNEEYSLAAMQLESHSNSDSHAPIHSSSLMAKKAWFMFDDEVVALGSDIDANDGFEVQTVVENRKLSTTAETITVDGETLTAASIAKKSIENPTYVNIGGTGGYYFPTGGSLVMDKVTNTKDFLEMWFTHGVSPTDGTYTYVLLPKKTASETEEYSLAPDIEVLSNTEKVQSVREKTLGVTGTVFWEADTFDYMTASQPMMVMTENKDGQYKVSISDPTKKLTSATLKLAGEYNLVSCDNRCSVSTTDVETVITVDFAGSKGRSLPVVLKTIRDPETIASEDFESFEGSEITYSASATASVAGVCCSTLTKVDETKDFYIDTDKSVSIVSDPETSGAHGKVAQLSDAKFGISEHNQKSSPYFVAKTKLPDKIKFEFDVWKESGSEVTVRYGNTSDAGRLMTLNAENGVTMYAQNPDDSSAVLSQKTKNVTLDAQKWIKYTLCLDSVRKRAVLYADGEKISAWTLVDSWTADAPDLTFAASGTAYIDNFKITEHKDLIIESTNPADNEKWVSQDITFKATFNRELSQVDNTFVDVTDGETSPSYEVSTEGNVLTITFPSGLEIAKEYTVTFKGNIESEDGIRLGEDTSVSFETLTFDTEKFTSKIVDWDFEDVSTADLSDANKYIVDANADTQIVDLSESTVAKDEGAEHGNVLQFGKTDSTAATTFKIADQVFTNYRNANGGSNPTKVKVSFDIRKTQYKAAYMLLNGTSATGRAIVTYSGGSHEFNFYDGTAKSAAVTIDDPSKMGGLNLWFNLAMYFDFDAMEYHVYVDDEFIATYKIHTDYANGITRINFTTLAQGVAQLDNIKVYAYEDFALTSTSPADAATVSPELKAYTATFNNDLGNVTGDMVTITSADGTVPSHTVSATGKNLTVNFDGDFTPGKTYTITFGAAIPTSDGLQTLGTAASKTFTVSSSYAVSGFDTKIVDVDFDTYGAGTTIAKHSQYGYDAANAMILMNKDLSVVSEDGRVALEVPKTTSSDGRVGIYATYLRSADRFYNKATATAPKMLKLKLGLKAASGTVINLTYSSKALAQFNLDTNGRCNFGYAHHATNEYSLVYQQKNVWKDGEWNDVEMYIDFQNLEYHVFVNGAFVLTTTLPEGYTKGMDQFYLTASANNKTIYVSDMSMYTVSAYEKPEISEYTLPTGKEMAFVYNNEDAENAKTIKVIKTKYDSAGVLLSTEVENVTVDPTTSILHKLDYPTIPTGGYCEYFVWEGFDLMKPITNVKIFR